MFCLTIELWHYLHAPMTSHRCHKIDTVQLEKSFVEMGGLSIPDAGATETLRKIYFAIPIQTTELAEN
jgi:hypothetical protein